MDLHHVSMNGNGRLVVPAAVRSALGMEQGGTFVLTVEENGALRLEPVQAVIARVQDEVGRYIPESVDLAAELSADRRAEAGDV